MIEKVFYGVPKAFGYYDNKKPEVDGSDSEDEFMNISGGKFKSGAHPDDDDNFKV